MTFTERLFDFGVANQIRFARYANGKVVEGIAILSANDKEIADILAAVKYPAKMADLVKKVDATLIATHSKIVQWFQEVADEVALETKDIELRALKSKKILTEPSKVATLEKVRTTLHQGATLKEWFAEFARNDRNRVIRQLKMDLIIGRTPGMLTKNIIGTKINKHREGIREVTRRGLSHLTRTMVAHAQATGREAVWSANAAVIRRVVWVSVLDTHTSEICRHLDGKTFPVDEGPRPPAHLNCRSTVIALLWGEKLPNHTTWFDWLARQPQDVQKEALGATRYQLWKEGKVKPTKFADADGERYTLAELRERMPTAFERIES